MKYIVNLHHSCIASWTLFHVPLTSVQFRKHVFVGLQSITRMFMMALVDHDLACRFRLNMSLLFLKGLFILSIIWSPWFLSIRSSKVLS